MPEQLPVTFPVKPPIKLPAVTEPLQVKLVIPVIGKVPTSKPVSFNFNLDTLLDVNVKSRKLLIGSNTI